MRRLLSLVLLGALPLLLVLVGRPTAAEKQPKKPAGPTWVIPHGQDTMPGPALSPQEAARKMTVPEGFSVEVVASEPDIVNPVAMTFDERGRIWITESLEYPRHSAGPGRDRIKILESTRGDGKYDKITVFAEGLNIPSGIAVGNGGVYVANSPDILFYREKDGKAVGKPEVIVTGFGRHDTHELPNSLAWGPDGWLYGLNGVFNQAHVRHQGKDFVFTCAMFRLHPKTKEFQLFCEGTSNPWGIAWDPEGSAFVSACVIDHLWHLVETGYYHRQGGPYPPFTWQIGSIVRHHHQKAAYCGLHYFDSDAYPPEYRGRLYMGNIHGGCINVDVLHRDGSTYRATGAPDFLRANDPWFMPVSQKTGPDGCLYVLDWYDRYHCYQDAMRDPKGIDRERGRLYRIRYKNYHPAGRFDLAKETDDQLIKRLASPNVYFRDTAQRLLRERNTPAIRGKLQKLVLDAQAPRKARMHALWALVGGGPLEPGFHAELLKQKDPTFRAWAVRAAGNAGKVEAGLRERILGLANDPSPDVKLQVAIAARKIRGIDPVPVLVDALKTCGEDPLIPHIVWQNLHPLLEERGHPFVTEIRKIDLKKAPALARLLPRVLDRLLARRRFEPDTIVDFLDVLARGQNGDPAVAGQCLVALTSRIQTGEVPPSQAAVLAKGLQPVLRDLLKSRSDSPAYLDAVLLAATLKEPRGVAAAREVLTSTKRPVADRLRAIHALIAGGDDSVLKKVGRILAHARANSAGFRGQILAALGRSPDPRVAEVVLENYTRLEPDLRPKAVELLTQRPVWARQLLAAIARKKISPDALNVNQIRRLQGGKDPEMARQVRAIWGTVRLERNPQREKVVTEMKKFLRHTKGDPFAGRLVFQRVCAQCHKIYGEGQDVGPDLTGSGRGSFDQLVSNVFDPSLVIGTGYQATTVTTTRGRLLTGLVVENSKQRVVLKLQGGKQEVIPRDEVDTVEVSKLSLMPEDLEKQLKPQEIADLFAFLCLDRPPTDPKARKIPGAP